MKKFSLKLNASFGPRQRRVTEGHKLRGNFKEFLKAERKLDKVIRFSAQMRIKDESVEECLTGDIIYGFKHTNRDLTLQIKKIIESYKNQLKSTKLRSVNLILNQIL